MSRRFVALFLIFAVVLLLYYPVFGVYFSQDDFFHFKASQTDGSSGAFIRLFGFPTFEERGYAFYRPVFREGFYNLYYSLFGLNAIPFRIFSLLIHFINIFLVYVFLQKLFKIRELSLFTAFFFGISASNVGVLYYGAGGIETSGVTMFLLSSLLFFWKYLEGQGKRFKVLSFTTYLFALSSHEIGAMTSILLAGLVCVKEKSPRRMLKKIVGELWIFFTLLLAYLYLDIVRIGFLQKEEQYQVVLSIKKTINSLSWYAAWALGAPEMLIDFVRPGLKLNPSLMRYWGGYFGVILPAFFVSIIILGGGVSFLLLRERRKLRDKRFWFLLLWFLLALFPVIFLPLHKFTHYLAPALPAFWGAVGFVIFMVYKRLKNQHQQGARMLLGAALAFLVILSATSARLGESLYWAASRGRIAERLLNETELMYPQLPKGAIVYFKNDPNYPFIAEEWGSTSKQASFVLNGEDALQLFYHDPTLKVFYEDLGGVPKDFSQDTIYPVIARLEQ